MEKGTYYVGLELTSQAIKLVVGYGLNTQICVLSSIESSCNGMRNGLINDQKSVEESIKKVIEKVEKQINIKIDEVTISLPPMKMTCMTDSGSTNTVDGNDIIKHVDVTNIITAMKKKHLSDEDLKIIHVVPDSYILDNNDRYSVEPIGKISTDLSLHAALYAMSHAVVQQFVSCIQNIGLKVKNKVIAPYASALYLSTLRDIPDSYILLDIGHSLTTVSQVYNKTTIVNSDIFQFGGSNITNAIKEEFGISLEDAEMLKQIYGIDEDPNFAVYIYNKDGKKITLNQLKEVIESRLEIEVEKIEDTLQRFSSNVKADLPVIIIGGGSQIHNLDQYLASKLNLEVVPYTMNSIGARDRSFVTSLGLIRFCEIQPKINEAEQIVASITRVDNKKIKKNSKDDIL